ncbi:MAG: T9SS type A sorting domain-containing protein [Saprospiraceae bacterium]|nr:T9SS type A sorting domain-containing protein [Saprospiraceae bacterium]
MLKLDNTFRPVTINTSALASGFYLVKIQSGNHVSTRKLIIK